MSVVPFSDFICIPCDLEKNSIISYTIYDNKYEESDKASCMLNDYCM